MVHQGKGTVKEDKTLSHWSEVNIWRCLLFGKSAALLKDRIKFIGHLYSTYSYLALVLRARQVLTVHSLLYRL